jgi:hypothetical protein
MHKPPQNTKRIHTFPNPQGSTPIHKMPPSVQPFSAHPQKPNAMRSVSYPLKKSTVITKKKPFLSYEILKKGLEEKRRNIDKWNGWLTVYAPCGGFAG